MPCGKKPLVKKWDKPKKIKVVKPSRYEQNEASVKVHWKNVVKDLELFYKDDKFWESQSETVRGLVGPVVFARIADIFNLAVETAIYEPLPSDVSIVPSEEFYVKSAAVEAQVQRKPDYSMTDFEPSSDEEEEEEEPETAEAVTEQSEQWSMSSDAGTTTLAAKKSTNVSLLKRSQAWASVSKSINKFSRTTVKSSALRIQKEIVVPSESDEESPRSSDDLFVNPSRRHIKKFRSKKNPHFEMLYCNESETDMIKWNSKYKTKVFEVSASDEFSKKAEIVAKQICRDFYDWWEGLGSGADFKTEIKRPEDIEDLFQVWFDEHATRSLVVHPIILPCVLPSIAKAVGVPKCACPSVLKRQIAFDILGETTPAHTMAFGTSLPTKFKHLPPNNDTEKMWHSVRIPEDLRTMSCVWHDVSHLTSTKAFQKWLEKHPHLPMPECLQRTGSSEKKQLFVVPSDYVIKDATNSAQELALPVSQFSLELKEVLSKLMNE